MDHHPEADGTTVGLTYIGTPHGPGHVNTGTDPMSTGTWTIPTPTKKGNPYEWRRHTRPAKSCTAD